MKLITKNTDYAIRALLFMAKKRDKMWTVLELAKDLKIPKAFLRRIFQILNKEKMITSYKGKNGGFKLTLQEDNMFLIDLIKIFQGPINIIDCSVRAKLCPDMKKCILKGKLKKIENYIASELKPITIKSLLRE